MVGPTIRKRQLDRVAGADDRRGRLEEHAVLLDGVDLARHDRPHLLDVQAVVRRRRDDLGGEHDGRAEPDAVERDAGAGEQRLVELRTQSVEPGDRAQDEHGRPFAAAAAHEGADVDQGPVTDETDTAVVVDRDPHRRLSFAGSTVPRAPS